MVIHRLGFVKVPAIYHNGKADCGVKAHQIDVGKFLPVRQNQHRVGVLGRRINICGIAKLRRGRHHCFGALHGRRIVRRHRGARVQQPLDDVDSRRLSNIVGIALESQAQRRQPLAAQRPQRREYLVEEDLPLRFVDLAHLVEKLKIHAPLLGNPVERGHVLWKAGASVT